MRITVSLPDQQNEFQLLQVADAIAAAKRLGCDAEVLDAHNHSLEQVQGLFQAMRSEPTPHALIIEPVSPDVMRAVAPKAAALGIACVVINCSVESLSDLRSRYPGLPIVAIGSDQMEIGRVQGRQLEALLPAGGNVLYI